MDLKIKDVAELLNISQTTVRRWLKDGKIPAYQLNHCYRFNREEIEDWMMKCKLKLGKDGFSPFEEKQIYPASYDEETGLVQPSGTQQFSLYRAISKGGILRNIAAKNKQELIKLVMQQSASRLGLDPHVIAELLIDRESLMSTALNYGLAVPHPRDLVLSPTDADKIITVFPETPIDYGALDGEAVHTLFFLFSSSDKKHLHLLSKLAHLGSQPCAIDFLASKPTPEALLAYIKEWETKVENKPHNPNPKRRQ